MGKPVEISDKWRRQIETWVSDAGFGDGTWRLLGKQLWLLIGEKQGTINVGDGIYVSNQTSRDVHRKIQEAGRARKAYQAYISSMRVAKSAQRVTTS